MTTNERSIVCIEPDCKKTFSLTSGEIEFYVQRDFSLPKRCKPCRHARKNKNFPDGKTSVPKVTVVTPSAADITCSNCGRNATVPFRPIPNKPVYCKICWEGIKNVITVSANEV